MSSAITPNYQISNDLEKNTAVEGILKSDQVSTTSTSSQASNGEEIFTYTEEEERIVVRKLDQRVLVICTVLFLFSFLSRANIGSANLAGMSTSLNMSSSDYQWLLTMFYIGYVVSQPCTLLFKVFPPRAYIAFLVFCWGLFSVAQSAVHNWAGMMVLRLFLGLGEGAYSPPIPYYFSFFYARKEIGFRQGLFLAAAPIATAFAGALGYAITSINNASIDDWRILYLIEGIPALIMVPIAYFGLPNRATTAPFLTEREKKITLARVAEDGSSGRESGLKLGKVWEGLKDPKAWLHAMMYFSCNVSYSSLPVFLPTIINEMGFTAIHAQGLSAPPYLLSFFVLLAASFYSDKIGDRSKFIIPLAIMGSIGYLILAITKSTPLRYFAIYLCASGIFPVIALILPWVSNMHENDSSRGAGFMLLNLVGQCGPFLGTRIYPSVQGPYYGKGMAICSAFMLFVAVLAFILRLILIRENKKRDELYGIVTSTARVISNVQEKVEDTDSSHTFRYLL